MYPSDDSPQATADPLKRGQPSIVYPSDDSPQATAYPAGIEAWHLVYPSDDSPQATAWIGLHDLPWPSVSERRFPASHSTRRTIG